jgi:hypothetical protein
MYITVSGEDAFFVCMLSGGEKPLPDRLISFARCLGQVLPIRIVSYPGPRVMKPARSNSCAAFVMVGLWNPAFRRAGPE